MADASEKKHCLNCGYNWWPWDHCCANPRFEPMTKTPQEMAKAHADEVYEHTPGFPSEKEWAYLKAYYAYLAGLAEGKRLGLEEAAKVAEDCGNSNVENPAIDWYERSRRMGIRWCGEWAAQRIRALLPKDAPSAGERKDG